MTQLLPQSTTVERPGADDIDLERIGALVEQALTPTLPDVELSDRRTRNRYRTKAAILQSAWRLFLTKGYEGTTIQDITEDADIGKGTFFSHFAKKSDVALFLCTHRRDTVLELYRRGAFGDGSASDRVERMMHTFAELNADPNPESRLMTDIVLREFFAEPALMGPDRPPIELALEEILASGVEAGEFPSRIDCAAGARLLHAAFYSAKAEWLRSGPYELPFDLASRVREDTRIVLRGLRD